MDAFLDIFSLNGTADDVHGGGDKHESGARPIALLDCDLRERTPGAGQRAPLMKVRALEMNAGPCDCAPLLEQHDRRLGLLVLDGLLLVQLEAGRGHVGWLAGQRDLLRPWELQESGLTNRASWQVLQSTRLAVLDDGLMNRAPDAAALFEAMLSHSAGTAHWLLAKSLIVSCPLLEDRLMLMFALLGERWGKVTPDGILLDLPLTHELLATLCGARRPSVTIAIGELRNDGILKRANGSGWLLTGGSSSQRAAQLSAWQTYAQTLGLA